ncbi:aminoglycoside phosphotransferase family protein [Croceicoccus marinus]|uniref:Aminoglycoside phosphotransferase n=1 Tax=Croceicoccus marinus TaxID=450378 RepID=A0A1Z1F9E0_9SPHN|nr:phosphotransferase [Croceicoccus marinus]ARU15346.1 aminoglycoside phosphotransferase [Croceicoccus marinus]
MNTPASASRPFPPHARAFLDAAGWGDGDIHALPGDASFRRYFRVVRSSGSGKGESAMLMDAPPPHEDPGPFLKAAHYLADHGFRAPAILAEDAGQGLVLLEDFGHRRMRDHLDRAAQDEHDVYAAAVDVLARLADAPAGPFDPYDLNTYLREAKLFTEWFCVAHGLAVDDDGFEAAWREVLAPVLDTQAKLPGGGVTVLRDYHAENVMLLDSVHEQGLLDFQDALVGHPAYDLVSLLQDARRDVAPELEAAMLDHYRARTGAGEDFLSDYAILGAQRNAKIVGIFVRLSRRDGKHHYLGLIPRVWDLLERDLAHPALEPVARWMDANIPGELRAASGATGEA